MSPQSGVLGLPVNIAETGRLRRCSAGSSGRHRPTWRAERREHPSPRSSRNGGLVRSGWFRDFAERQVVGVVGVVVVVVGEDASPHTT